MFLKHFFEKEIEARESELSEKINELIEENQYLKKN